MKIELDSFIKAFSALPDGVVSAELDAERREEQSVMVSNGAASGGEYFDVFGLYLRATAESTGYVYTENLSSDPYALILEAVENTQGLSAVSKEPLNCDPRPLRIYAEDDGCGYEEMLDLGKKLEQEARKHPDVASADVSLCKTTFSRRVINSQKLDRYAENIYYEVMLIIELKRADGSNTQGYHTVCVPALKDVSGDALIPAAIANAQRLDAGGTLPPIAVRTGKYRAVLSASAVTNILMTAWRMFSGDNILSGVSPLHGIPGEVVGNKHLNIISAPSCPGWGCRFPMDAEGTLTDTRHIVKEGILQSPLHNLRSARNAKTSATGHAGRGVTLSGVSPINMEILPNIFYIEPSQVSEEALLAKLQDGIYITNSFDEFHSVNFADGTFSIPCQGILYRNSQSVGYDDQITIAGSLSELFSNLEGVADNLLLREFNYKNYCYGGPSLLVRELIVGGKG